MDKISLEEGLRDLPLSDLRYFARLESTNTEAARWADSGARDMALVVADEQTAGRGRSGRSWYTPPGAALAFSLVLKNPEIPGIELTPDGAPAPPVYDFEIDFNRSPKRPGSADMQARLGRLSALGAVAVASALETNYGLQAQVKWPNDVLLDRRKVCGILTEAHWQGDRMEAAILGIGVNVSAASVPDNGSVLYPATSIESVLGSVVDRIMLIRSILSAIIEWRGRIASSEFFHVWDRKLAFKGEKIRIYSGVELDTAPDVEGELLGLDERGCLRLRVATGEERVICSGELRLRPTD